MVPARVVGVEVAQDDGVVARWKGAWVELALAVVVWCSADGRLVNVPAGEWCLAEDTHATRLRAVVRMGRRAVCQGGGGRTECHHGWRWQRPHPL